MKTIPDLFLRQDSSSQHHRQPGGRQGQVGSREGWEESQTPDPRQQRGNFWRNDIGSNDNSP